MITIHVLAGGELVQHVLNAVTSFMKQDSFLGLLRITALIGIVMATVGYLKTRNPMSFAHWFLGYVLFVNLILLPKTSVLIDDISAQNPKLVDNVPVVFALSASLVTTIGYGLAQSYDALLTMPDDLQYTQTGALFGSRLIQAATSFRIIDPVLKEEMNEYFRVCVVGDIRMNRKYSVGDLAHSTNLWDLISAKASPLRMLAVNGNLVTCAEASKPDGQTSLRKKLDSEIKKAYTFFGVNLFGKPKDTTYEALFSTHLKSAFDYYQGLTDSASNVFLQSMMINAMKEGIGQYQAFTDATAGVVNQQFTKSQVQHRWSWEVLGQKALWILPITHTCLTLLLFGVFPLIIALTTLPGGVRILYGYLQFFMSLQFWPVLFAILNAGMTIYGASSSGEYGQFTMVNLNQIDELHADISGACGYLMMLIPFLSHGLVSNLGGAFSNLATSMMSHMQGSSMSVAGEAAGGSFALGQTSFYNTTANNFSANKHDSNWSHLHGMQTEQLGSGVLKTISGNGERIFDVSPGMTRSAVSINTAEGLSASLNQAYEKSSQAALNETNHYQSALSRFAHRAVQLSQLQGHDMRLGQGVSESESSQYSKALSTLSHIAEDVAQRMGVSKEDALTHLTSGGWGAHSGINTNRSIFGKLAQWGTGLHAGGDAHLKFDRSSSSSNRYHQGMDGSLSSREAQDFNKALNYVQHFSQTHHLDDSHSEAASLSKQMGTDLREAESASHNVDANRLEAARISKAKSFIESHSAQVNTDLNQAFPAYVTQRIGEAARDELFARPGDMQALNQLQKLGHEFIAVRRDELIAEFGTKEQQKNVDSFYHQAKQGLESRENQLGVMYRKNTHELEHDAHQLKLGIDANNMHTLPNNVQQKIKEAPQHLNQQEQLIRKEQHDLMENEVQTVHEGKVDAQKNVILTEKLPRTWGLHTKGE
ncbi:MULTISPECIES: conjugal transfer mating-pair stabilization protein TraG [Legionellaceae]|uniref:Mating contact stabilization protein TraG n=1 Tax=Legionella bozemanae TaxID=447 RepID=A0A0W0R9G8_LEGBO|nr:MULTISPECIES: conjugal transfer mating-pair stabilization protein TraG [Legionellaceae]KTC67712.1 mating contact stabilization protein TraG [Legionella bozemanae]MCW8497069.1 conjugal transfer mating pair stabilization protein TraG [Fluoribacter dumoffii]STO32901.1 conjugal transfer mating pair stabilization protein TraG [Legionella bozemanae]